MSTAITLLDKNFRELAQTWREICQDVGLEPVVTSTRRSLAEQQRLYAAFKSGRSRYPAAYPGTSTHEWGLAMDMDVTPHGALTIIGPIWESLGQVWGGRFADPIHFEAGPEIKKLAGYVKGAPYEAPLEKVDAPWEPTPGKGTLEGLVLGPIVSPVTDFFSRLLGL